MIFMHILPLVILTIIFGGLSAFWIIFLLTKGSGIPLWVYITTFSLSAFFTVWLIGSGTRDLKVDFVEYLDIQDVAGPNDTTNQVTWYKIGLNNYGIINVNNFFSCVAPKGYKVKHIHYKSGPYCGVSYDTCKPHHAWNAFELVKSPAE